MGTRSAIGVEAKCGKILWIYCHWDGYVAHNGKILKEHYTNADKIRKLLELGDISSLGEEIGEKHNFDVLEEYHAEGRSWCNAYMRDRGETDVEAKDSASRERFKIEAANMGCEYMYLNLGRGIWYYTTSGIGAKFAPLNKNRIKEAEAEFRERVAALKAATLLTVGAVDYISTYSKRRCHGCREL
jgi:hypothetical protein